MKNFGVVGFLQKIDFANIGSKNFAQLRGGGGKMCKVEIGMVKESKE